VPQSQSQHGGKEKTCLPYDFQKTNTNHPAQSLVTILPELL